MRKFKSCSKKRCKMENGKVEKSINQLVKDSIRDSECTYELWERLLPLCMKWARKLKAIDYSGEDLLQESYLILLKALKTYKVEEEMRFEAYFKYMLYRWGRNYMRKKREVLAFDGENYDFWCNVADEKVDVEAQILKEEEIRQLEHALKSLKEDEYTLLIDLYLRETPLKDLAKDKHMSYKGLTSKKYYTLKKLKKFFEEKQTLLRIYKV